ncbi:hypothetical protein AAFF_G00439970 [Aldrovandia affinis]|uniref:Uncharacterized protein n=1 Tax=Aldrovandia affinis TaxID=143900 RepID=A0AAD7R3D1_9TELE|nr:hypothetical protein AAFF_G00439970 [Aldrovandia affinis]
MDKLDDVTVGILRAANISEIMLDTLLRDDLRDLFPGPQNFIRRRTIWHIIHPERTSLQTQTDIGHVMDELRRILDRDNCQYIDEVKGRWADFCQKVQFYGVSKKILKPPMGMDKDHTVLQKNYNEPQTQDRGAE